MATVRSLGHFPWCVYLNKQSVIDSEVFDETTYQFNINVLEGLSIPLAQAMKLYWVVKTWRATGSFQSSSPSSSITVNYQYTYKRNCSTEKDLVCASPIKGLIRQEPLLQYSHPDVIGIQQMQGAEFEIFSLGFVSLNRSCMFSNINPENIFVWQNVYFLGTTDGDLAEGIIESRTGETPTTYSLSAFGLQYQIPALKYSSLSSSVSIDAIEYWPYDPNDGGGPIYDSLTGAQLRPFP